MIFNMNGGGGGTALNFTVVGGTTQPTNPSENTIWVNTDIAISSWIFSATKPENATEGMVWFRTDTSSNVAMNALKKNSLWVYPAACEQYVSSAWVTKTAKTYQGGAWVNWATYLYKDGNQYTDVTGGWRSANGWSVAGLYSISAQLTYGETMYTNAVPVNSARGSITGLIDLTRYKALKFTLVDRNSVAKTYMYASVLSQAHHTFGTDDHAHVNFAEAAIGSEVSLDISSLNGSYYIGFATLAERSFSVNNIRLE